MLAIIFLQFFIICNYNYQTAYCSDLKNKYVSKAEAMATIEADTGKLQGIRMIFFVLIPMLLGPTIGNAINAAKGERLSDQTSADTMTTLFIPAAEIFLAAALISLLLFALIPVLSHLSKKQSQNTK